MPCPCRTEEHIPSADAITPENSSTIAAIFEHIPEIAKAAAQQRLPRHTNVGPDACGGTAPPLPCYRRHSFRHTASEGQITNKARVFARYIYKYK